MAAHGTNIKPQPTWPKIVLGNDETQAGYVHPGNIQLLLDLTQDALKSQIEGVRQMFSRLGTVLAQASALASASAAAVIWLITHPVADRPAWFTWAFFLALLCWTASGAMAVAGMVGAKFGVPGIDPKEGYKQDVLSQSVRDMQLWVIQSHAGTLADGQTASDRVRRFLNAAIVILLAAPLPSLILRQVGFCSSCPCQGSDHSPYVA